jgi:hypothetical protein
VTPREEGLLPRIQGRQAEPPCWGDRRIGASWHGVAGLSVTKTRGLRVRREHHLWVTPHPQRQAKRSPSRSQPRPTTPHAWWGREMTKVMGEGVGWGSIVLVVEGDTHKSVGDDAGVPWTARPWLAALAMAVSRQCPEGARDQGVSLMRDHGCQPTALACMKAGSTWGLQPAFTRANQPNGNAATERVMRTLNEACLWRQE